SALLLLQYQAQWNLYCSFSIPVDWISSPVVQACILPRVSRGTFAFLGLLLGVVSNKVPVVQPSHGVHPLTPLIPYSNEHFSHGSHSPHLPADINQKQGVHRPSQTSDISGFYPLPPSGVGQITPSMGW
ncbi:hypothetical protein lerEdw1_016292, partial [Lerista edwardsae]